MDGCEKDAQRAGYCWGHYARPPERRSGELRAYGLPPFEHVQRAALDYGNVEGTTADFVRVRERLRLYMKRANQQSPHPV